MIEPNKRGFFTEESVLATGFPIVDFGADLDSHCDITWFTFTELKHILNIHLTEEERKNDIAAFMKMENGQGYTALYSFMDILLKRER